METNIITRIEPLSWWIGMKTPLQLMIQGKNLAGAEIRVLEEGLKIEKIHTADSPNYLFVDIDISTDANPGEYTFELTKEEETTEFKYLIEKRRRGSANRKSFSAADMVYLLMPDRFACGNPDIDCTEDTIEKVDRKNPFGRHGGDLQGIINHLDYLADLGVTTLWITPTQLDDEKEQSYHGYACSDYYHVDPRYGDNELYKNLVAEAHKWGMKVVMDAVPNHCGTSHWWMKDLPFEDWIHQHKKFLRSNYRLATVTDPNKSQEDYFTTVDGWFDKSMPDMALENPYVLQYFKQLYIWWVEWADLDGLRVDTFPYNDKNTIAEWTRSIREEYPNINIVAECWHSSPAIVAYWDGNTPNRDGYTSYLPCVMDFPLQEALDKALAKSSSDWGKGMNVLYEALALDFVFEDPRKLLLFLDNHDTARFADSVKGDTDKIKFGLTLLATLREIPQVYYGTEYGFMSTDLSSDDGAARKDFPGGWKGDRKNLFTGLRCSKKEAEIYEHARILFNWRKTATVIHTGKTIQFLPENDIYSYIRYTNQEAVLVFLNPTKECVKVDWKKYADYLSDYVTGINILDNKSIKIGGNLKVNPGTSLVIHFQK
ncbi:MAG: glycoside hydrolase family 13 protein [Odoribacter sp.]|nr:glycoside hydrolase family 13 protein [Odoribacter sp.]